MQNQASPPASGMFLGPASLHVQVKLAPWSHPMQELFDAISQGSPEFAFAGHSGYVPPPQLHVTVLPLGVHVSTCWQSPLDDVLQAAQARAVSKISVACTPSALRLRRPTRDGCDAAAVMHRIRRMQHLHTDYG